MQADKSESAKNQAGTKKNPGLTIARPYLPTGSLLPEALDELPN